MTNWLLKVAFFVCLDFGARAYYLADRLRKLIFKRDSRWGPPSRIHRREAIRA